MAEWIIVVDDDISNLKVAGRILSKAGMRVTALQSGRLLLDYVRKNGCPDLILMDINMPEMDGFETMDQLRMESSAGEKVPVVFLTAEEDNSVETRSLLSGAMDYIRKPFDPDVLVSRVRKTLEIHNRMLQIEKDAETDQLTGFFNKATAEAKLGEMCRTDRGLLCVLDLDSFKSVNDLHGHETGDRILVMFADLLRKNSDFVTACGRIGGDEFLVFARHLSRAEDLASFSERINKQLLNNAKEILGEHMVIPLGVSIGAVAIPEYGREYNELFRRADQALYIVKKNGKHGCKLYEGQDSEQAPQQKDLDLETITAILEERTVSPSAMWMGREVFGSIYRYMVRYMDRYHSSAYRVLYTVKVAEGTPENERNEILTKFRNKIRNSLRNSDVMMECGDHQLFLLLPEIQEYDIERVLSRLLSNWRNSEYAGKAEVDCEYGPVHPRPDDREDGSEGGNWVAVVDDDESNLKLATHILQRQGMRVSTFTSGQALLDFVKDHRPSLILLDILMPGLNGFETMQLLKQETQAEQEIPVIFLTADDSLESEARCLQLGAMDFLKKPFVPDVLALRVRHTMELVRLQRNLADAVDRKTRENEKLSLHVVQTLAEAIDAKDKYTKGHSGRVAEYAREIAQRYGYNRNQQDEIYMMGLLHDVGKIGIPDAIINKPGKLTPEEYAVIKTHSAVGARILGTIEEMPRLTAAARWHHERYDGTGYPDGLSGTSIPEQARIIAVADAYDAMSSRRSYRDMLPQDVVRREIMNGKGTQFDPMFADIMLVIIDQDKNYQKRGPDKE